MVQKPVDNPIFGFKYSLKEIENILDRKKSNKNTNKKSRCLTAVELAKLFKLTK